MLNFIYVFILAADLWAIYQILRSRSGNGKKAFWIIVILILPVLGLVIWIMKGKRQTF